MNFREKIKWNLIYTLYLLLFFALFQILGVIDFFDGGKGGSNILIYSLLFPLFFGWLLHMYYRKKNEENKGKKHYLYFLDNRKGIISRVLVLLTSIILYIIGRSPEDDNISIFYIVIFFSIFLILIGYILTLFSKSDKLRLKIFFVYSIVLLISAVSFLIISYYSAMSYNNRGWSKYQSKDYLGAIEDYDKAIKLDSNLALAYNNRGLSKYNLKDTSGALIDWNKAIELDSNFAMSYNNRGWSKYESKDYSGAIEDYDKAIKLDSNLALAYNNRGLSKYNLKDTAGALIDWNKTIELDSNLIYPWFNKGNLNFFLKNYSDAIDDYTRAIELNSNFALAYYNRGINKDSIGDLSGACEDWKVAVSLGDEEAKKWITDKCN